MTSTADMFVEPAHAHPPRFWWLKRIIVISILLLVVFVALMAWWKHAADTRLQSEVDAIHARGEAILIDDFKAVPVRDDQNAALSLKAAAAALSLTAAQSDFVSNIDRFAPLDAQSRTTLELIDAASQTSAQLVRVARFQPQVDWGTTIRSPAMTIPLPNLAPQRQLTRVLAADAIYEHAVGHDAQAVEITRDLLRQSAALDDGQPFLISHLVAIGISGVACEVARGLSYDLSVLPEQSASTTNPSSAASREQARALIATLSEETTYRKAYVSAFQGERAGQYDVAVTSLGQPGSMLPQAAVIARPMFQLDVIRMMRVTDQYSAAGSAANLPAAKAMLPDLLGFVVGTGRSSATASTRILSRIIMPSLDRSVLMHFRGLMHRRVTALMLAIRLYKVDHNGRYPQTLTELVPNYLPQLPADPLAGDGRTFGYRLSPRPMLWSVGDDGIDDGGSERLYGNRKPAPSDPPAGDPRDFYQWERVDLLFDLVKPAPLPPKPTDEN